MTEDENQQPDFIPTNNEGGGGQRGGGTPGGGCLTAFLPIILNLVFKRPLIGIPLLIAGGFIVFKMGLLGGGGSNAAPLATGAEMKQEVYDQSQVAAALAEDEKNPLPEFVSLEKFAPSRMDQGEQGSCVGWGSSYAARTILEASSTGQNPDDIAMSPSFVYNQIGNNECQGAYIINACKVMQGAGDIPKKYFEYTDQSCSRKPDQQVLQNAQQFKIRGYERLSKDGDDYTTDFYAIKQYLAKGAPVIIGNMVGGSFMQDMMGKKIWHPTQDDYSMEGFGGHCMCIIGYDDRMEGGAFQIMNSWGPAWGEQGIAWVRYKDFMHFNKEAYALQPLPKRGDMAARKFECTIGLVDNKTQQYIPLRNLDNLFSTISPIAKGTRFKIEVQNAIECYIYIFGQETDGSSYVLFPYTPKHTAYCGITGYRLFPKNQSLEADAIGNKDYMAIVVTKEAIDYKKLNDAINAGQGNYSAKVNSALKGIALSNVHYTSDKGRIGFSAESENKNAVASIIAIDKQ
ncbi:MAG TPA: C1 family peptidase [Chitinophagales bacterium]|nr:C1 family peptidase [Chitinophagales bacterium]